jgi:hypothetical protein
MLGKQAFVDILIVLIVPILIISGYYFWWRVDGEGLLSLSAPAQEDSSNEPGTKTKMALDALSIKLDDSLFKDPAYLALKNYVFDIPSVPLSRPYPFTPPPVIQELLREAKLANPTAPSSVPTLSIKLDTLKKSATK